MNKIEIKRMDYDFTVCKVADYSFINRKGKNFR